MKPIRALLASLFLFLPAANAEGRRFLYCASPDGAQVQEISGKGLLVFDVATKKKIATLADKNGRPFASSKFIEVHFEDDTVVEVGCGFGLGRKTEP